MVPEERVAAISYDLTAVMDLVEKAPSRPDSP
jgi:hypothetical protein